MFLIQALIPFYDRKYQLDLSKKNFLLMAHFGRTMFNIDGTRIHSN
jgi:hypothetical protein